MLESLNTFSVRCIVRPHFLQERFRVEVSGDEAIFVVALSKALQPSNRALNIFVVIFVDAPDRLTSKLEWRLIEDLTHRHCSLWNTRKASCILAGSRSRLGTCKFNRTFAMVNQDAPMSNNVSKGVPLVDSGWRFLHNTLWDALKWFQAIIFK